MLRRAQTFDIFWMNGNSSMVNSAQHLNNRKTLHYLLVLHKSSAKGTP